MNLRPCSQADIRISLQLGQVCKFLTGCSSPGSHQVVTIFHITYTWEPGHWNRDRGLPLARGPQVSHLSRLGHKGHYTLFLLWDPQTLKAGSGGNLDASGKLPLWGKWQQLFLTDACPQHHALETEVPSSHCGYSPLMLPWLCLIPLSKLETIEFKAKAVRQTVGARWLSSSLVIFFNSSYPVIRVCRGGVSKSLLSFMAGRSVQMFFITGPN